MSYTEQYRTSLLEAIHGMNLAPVDEAIAWLRETRAAGGQVFTCGNGGSASTASHFACDMLKGASYQREQRFRIIALTDLMPTLSAYANDVSYDQVFLEPLKNLARNGDLLLAISGSGNSRNVLAAVDYANGIGCRTIGLTGRDGGQLARLAQLNIHVSEPHMGRVEDAHMIVCHMIAYAFMDSEKPR